MDRELIKNLKIAANQFYLNKYLDQPTISDEEYDSLAKEYEATIGNNVKDLVEWEPGSISIENEPEDPLDKIIVTDNDLKTKVTSDILEVGHDDSEFEYVNLKYDGGGIKLVYDESGRLQRIQSTPDEEFGIIRTDQFWDIVPHELDPKLGIKCLRGEVLVDPLIYGKLARNKANGLINSTVSQSEINKEAFIRIYKITYFDGEWSVKRQFNDLQKLPELWVSRLRVNKDDEEVPHIDRVFASAICFALKDIPSDPIVSMNITKDIGTPIELMDSKAIYIDTFLCDGVVVYSTQFGIRGYKYYYTDSEITTIRDITWKEQSNGSYAAVVELDPIELDDKYIQRASSNGVPNMIEMGFGVGAKVKVILANTTIPKIIEVIEESNDFRFPKCECGYQLSEIDIYGSTIKCGNLNPCSKKVNKWIPEALLWLSEEYIFKDCDTFKDCLLINPYYIGWILHIDRWNPDNKRSYELNKDNDDLETFHSVLGGDLITCIEKSNFDVFKSYIDEMFYYSDLQYSNMEINVASAFEVCKHILNINFKTYFNETGD